jgi:hypothetical protein
MDYLKQKEAVRVMQREVAEITKHHYFAVVIAAPRKSADWLGAYRPVPQRRMWTMMCRRLTMRYSSDPESSAEYLLHKSLLDQAMTTCPASGGMAETAVTAQSQDLLGPNHISQKIKKNSKSKRHNFWA